MAGYGANLALADWNESAAASLLDELDPQEYVNDDFSSLLMN